jgi:hypothetical protein
VHWAGVKRVFRYLKSTDNERLVFNAPQNSNDITLQVYADADWGTDPEDRHSRTGVVSEINGNTFWWKSRKQPSVALSSCEAEYMALFEGAKDTTWLRNLLCEFGYCQGVEATRVLHDNQGSISWSRDDNLRNVKHIDLRYKYTHKLIQAGQVDVKYVPSAENVADCLAKPFAGMRNCCCHE